LKRDLKEVGPVVTTITGTAVNTHTARGGMRKRSGVCGSVLILNALNAVFRRKNIKKNMVKSCMSTI